jgi:hypothetical protein
VINAEETPLVAGTTGGAEYLPFAITESKEPTNATKLSFDAVEMNKVGEDKLAVQLVAASSTRSDMYGPVKMVVYLEFNTTDSILPADSLLFAEGNELNTYTAGSVDLVEQSFAGSHLAYHLAADMETMCHIWRIMSGSVVVEKNGSFVASGKLDNGKNFKITCTLPETAVEDVIFDQKHVEKLMRDGKIIISIDGVEYDMLGRMQ